MTWNRERGSFRDPAGFVFSCDGVLYRQVNAAGADHYRRFIDSGLYEELRRARLIVEHEEVALRLPEAPPALAVLRPERVPFISYPYEWCFGQLKDAALLTLEIQKRALRRGLVLRDASAFNVQFIGARPVFIDTLSLGAYEEGAPWAAYRQFCRHFLAPLALMSMSEPSLGELSQVHIDGVPLPLASSLLPLASRLRPGLLMHLHLHSRRDRGVAAGTPVTVRGSMSRTAMLGLVDSLERTVRQLSWTPPDTLWSTYARHANYSEAAQRHKHQVVAAMLDAISSAKRPQLVWDVGANTGDYSRLAAARASYVVSFDSDRAVVERHVQQLVADGVTNVLPLVQDVASPSPAVGWNHSERRSLADRGPADVAMALAFAHHMVIGCNVPLDALAAFFAGICRHLIVEFVPKEDSQVERMLRLRGDDVHEYSQDAFERAFVERFQLLQSVRVEDSARRLYLFGPR